MNAVFSYPTSQTRTIYFVYKPRQLRLAMPLLSNFQLNKMSIMAQKDLKKTEGSILAILHEKFINENV